MKRWWKVACPIAGLALLSIVACSDAPGDSDGPGETVAESTEMVREGSPPESVEAPASGEAPDELSPASTLSTTAPASEGEDEDKLIQEEGSRPVTEPDKAPEAGTSADHEAEVPVEDPEDGPPDKAPEVLGSSLSPGTDVLLSGSYRPDMEVRLGDGEIHATATGSIGPERRLSYSVHALEGQALLAALDAPEGLSIELRLDDEVIVSEDERSQRVEMTLPSGGRWSVGVVSATEDSADYVLTVRVLSPEPEPEPAKPVARRSGIAAGDIVYLTFDDGPHPSNTPQVLDILARHGARATFFVLGSLVERHPDLFQRIIAEGHTVANHTWKHENLAKLSREEFDRTISRTQDILGDHATPCLRPPYAATSKHTRGWAAEHGLEVHLWSVSANDWLGLTAEEIADRIVGQVTNGSVVLMHDGGGNRPQTVRGLEIVLDRLSGLALRYEPLCR